MSDFFDAVREEKNKNALLSIVKNNFFTNNNTFLDFKNYYENPKDRLAPELLDILGETADLRLSIPFAGSDSSEHPFYYFLNNNFNVFKRHYSIKDLFSGYCETPKSKQVVGTVKDISARLYDFIVRKRTDESVESYKIELYTHQTGYKEDILIDVDDNLSKKENVGKISAEINKVYSSFLLNTKKETTDRLVMSANPVDFMMASVGESWRSCISLDKSSNGPLYWYGLPGLMFDPNRVIFYQADINADTKQYLNMEVPHFKKRAFGSLLERVGGDDGFNIVVNRVYPENSTSTQEVFTQAFNEHFKKDLLISQVNLPGEVSQKHEIKVRDFGAGFFALPYQDNAEFSSDKMKLIFSDSSRGSSVVYYNTEKREVEENEVYFSTGGYLEEVVRKGINLSNYVSSEDDTEECEDCGDYFPRDDLIYTGEYGGEIYVCERCLNRNYNYSEYCRSYIHSDDSVYIESIGDYIHSDDAVELYNGDWAHDDDAIQLFNGQYAHDQDENLIELYNEKYAIMGHHDIVELYDGAYTIRGDKMLVKIKDSDDYALIGDEDIVCTYLGDYIFKKDATLLYDGEWAETLGDEIIQLVNGGYALLNDSNVIKLKEGDLVFIEDNEYVVSGEEYFLKNCCYFVMNKIVAIIE